MERKNQAKTTAKETDLARTTPSPFAWFGDVDRWFDSFRRNFEERLWSGPLARWSDSALQIREPLVDRIDKGSEFFVRAELPGVSKDDVDLTVTSDRIEIRARPERSRGEEDEDDFHQERTYQALHRVLAFPEEVKADLASATLKDGVLEVRIPKKKPTPETKPVKVPVEWARHPSPSFLSVGNHMSSSKSVSLKPRNPAEFVDAEGGAVHGRGS